MHNIHYFDLGESNYDLSKIKPSFRKAIFHTINWIEKSAFWWRGTADNQVRSQMIDIHVFSIDVAKEWGIWWLCSKEAHDRSSHSSYCCSYSALEFSSSGEIPYHHSFQIGWLYLKEGKFMSFLLPFSKTAD